MLEAAAASRAPIDLPSGRGLEAWRLDEAFLELAMARAATSDLVTLDVFDTAITRRLDSPADGFALAEQLLVQRLGAAGHGYAQVREDAERDVRLREAAAGAEEIGFKAILRRVGETLPGLAARLDEVAEAECDAERQVLVASPDIAALCRRLNAAGKPYAFVSDMYLPARIVADLLSRAGFSGWQALFVSSETGATKATGRQWDVVRAQLGPSLRLLHVGDDLHADIERPRAFGIETLHYARARSERRLAGPLSPAILPFSRAARSAALLSRAEPAAEATTAEQWRAQGRILGAIVVGAFLRWLQSRLLVHRPERIFFCARDGWLIQRAWRAAGLDRSTGIADRYLAVSRRPLNLARGALESTPGRLDPALLDFAVSTDGSTTLGVALSRLGLQDEPALIEELARGGRSLGDKLLWPEGTDWLRSLLSRHSTLLYPRLETGRQRLLAYLRQEGFEPGRRCAIVDIGWHGSMQRSLRTLLEAELGPTPLVGFYYGLWPSAGGNRYRAGIMEAAFGSDFIPGTEQPELHEAVEILEELHGAPHGTVTGHREAAGVWEPVYADSPEESRQYEAATRHFQDGTLQTVAELFATGASGTLRLADLTPQAARAALGSICLSPSARELEMFGALGHCATFDHAHLDPLVRPCGVGDVPKDGVEMQRELGASGWRLGLLRAWHQAAGGEAGGETRARIAAFAAASLPVPPRVLRQFTG